MTSSFELTEREKEAIRINSVERMINTTLRLIRPLRKSYNTATAEDASINYEDWTELKSLVTKLWNRERDTIFREMQGG